MIGTIHLKLTEKHRYFGDSTAREWRLENCNLYINSGSVILRHKELDESFLNFETSSVNCLGGLEDNDGLVIVGFLNYEGVYYKYLLDFWPKVA